MRPTFEYAGRGDTCMGCVDIIAAGDLVAADGRADHLLCVACWWLQECDLPLPAWTRRAARPGPA